MKFYTVRMILMILSLFVYSNSVLAYGSGGGTKTACKKPTFTAISPANMAEVAPRSAISFTASVRTNADTIAVTAKKLPLAISVTKNTSTYRVTGNLPADLVGTFARIVVSAKSPSGCVGEESWLVKITDTSTE